MTDEYLAKALLDAAAATAKRAGREIAEEVRDTYKQYTTDYWERVADRAGGRKMVFGPDGPNLSEKEFAEIFTDRVEWAQPSVHSRGYAGLAYRNRPLTPEWYETHMAHHEVLSGKHTGLGDSLDAHEAMHHLDEILDDVGRDLDKQERREMAALREVMSPHYVHYGRHKGHRWRGGNKVQQLANELLGNEIYVGPEQIIEAKNRFAPRQGPHDVRTHETLADIFGSLLFQNKKKDFDRDKTQYFRIIGEDAPGQGFRLAWTFAPNLMRKLQKRIADHPEMSKYLEIQGPDGIAGIPHEMARYRTMSREERKILFGGTNRHTIGPYDPDF